MIDTWAIVFELVSFGEKHSMSDAFQTYKRRVTKTNAETFVNTLQIGGVCVEKSTYKLAGIYGNFFSKVSRKKSEKNPQKQLLFLCNFYND
jgi:hypothetical protein